MATTSDVRDILELEGPGSAEFITKDALFNDKKVGLLINYSVWSGMGVECSLLCSSFSHFLLHYSAYYIVLELLLL